MLLLLVATATTSIILMPPQRIHPNYHYRGIMCSARGAILCKQQTGYELNHPGTSSSCLWKCRVSINKREVQLMGRRLLTLCKFSCKHLWIEFSGDNWWHWQWARVGFPYHCGCWKVEEADEEEMSGSRVSEIKRVLYDDGDGILLAAD